MQCDERHELIEMMELLKFIRFHMKSQQRNNVSKEAFHINVITSSYGLARDIFRISIINLWNFDLKTTQH